MEIELIRDKKTRKETMDSGEPYPIYPFRILEGEIDGGNFFVSNAGGSKLVFSFEKADRRVTLDIGEIITEAYKLAMEK